MEEQFDDSEELLRRALLDADTTVALALRIDGLALSDELTIIFHGRRDLGTLQTYVANGAHGAGAAISPSDSAVVPLMTMPTAATQTTVVPATVLRSPKRRIASRA